MTRILPGNRASSGTFGCQLVSTSRHAGGCGRIGGEMEGVDGHRGVGAGVRKPGTGEIADGEPGPVGQPEKGRPVRGMIYRDG